MNFTCQQCKQPLQLDASLVDLTPSAYDLLTSSLPVDSYTPNISDKEKLDRVPAPAAVKNTWKQAAEASSSSGSPLTSSPSRTAGLHPRRGLPTNESFVYLQDSVVQKIPSPGPSPSRGGRASSVKKKDAIVASPSKATAHVSSTSADFSQASRSPLSYHLRSTVKLLSLISSRTDIDHPLCAECTHILLSNLSRQLEETKRERDGYIAFEKELKKERELKEEPPAEMEERISKLKEEERVALERLETAQSEKAALEEELKALKLEEEELDEEEADFWTAYNQHVITTREQQAQLATLRAAYANDSAVLDKLERTNVYNDAFCIGHDGVFGTINGLRLGRVSGVNVEWAEINAAWGQALLLLYTMARKLDFTFENYRLVPLGSFSLIEKTTGDKTTYELYGSGDLHLGRLLHNRRFDFAMVAFLDCLRQMMEFVKSQDPSVEFPHSVVKDKIGDVSIKLQFGVEEGWTRALRHVLLALKLLLKWTTSTTN